MGSNLENKIKGIKKKIDNNSNEYESGTVTAINDFIVEVYGLDSVAFYEKVLFNNKGFGYVSKIEKNYVLVSIMYLSEKLVIGDSVIRTNAEFKGEFSAEAIGRVIDIFGYDKLAEKKFKNIINVSVEGKPIPLMKRRNVNRPLLTGVTGIDLIYPIGKGQRQLIIGDKKTGKTQLCLDTICNQANKNMICIYVAIGKTKKEVKEIYYELLKRNAMSYTIIISAFNDYLPTAIVATPYYALEVAKLYMENKYDVLVVLDDLKKHADTYRQIGLLSGKFPGRDAYPADIFYFHSRLLELGCQYDNGASITILPIVETKGEDITDYISTNIISITDGQIVLSLDTFQKGFKPAINYGLSVSRLGGNVQNEVTRKLGSKVRRNLLSYLETKEIYELSNLDEMSEEFKSGMASGQKIVDNLTQYKFVNVTEEEIHKKFKDIIK